MALLMAIRDTCITWTLGRGVELFLIGLPAEKRLPLRAYHAATIYKNGVPIGYFEGLSLFERMESGFNFITRFAMVKRRGCMRALSTSCATSRVSRRSRSILIRSDMRMKKESSQARSGFIASSDFGPCAERCWSWSRKRNRRSRLARDIARRRARCASWRRVR